MKVKVLLFAVARERAGVEQVELDLPDAARVADALPRLAELHPGLDGIIGRARVAVNQEFSEHERALEDGDELALIPPVSGG